MTDFEAWWEELGGDDCAFQYARDIRDVAKTTWDYQQAKIDKIVVDTLDHIHDIITAPCETVDEVRSALIAESIRVLGDN